VNQQLQHVTARPRVQKVGSTTLKEQQASQGKQLGN